MSQPDHPSPKERAETGKALRERVPRSSIAQWSPAPDRPDPVALIEEQNEGRIEWLVPVRRARMSTSPFAFFRGGARVMACDLAPSPVTGLSVQACGDAHLANFGFFASPERRLVFDVNDFDETLAGPWEWDVMRLAASFTIAAKHNGLVGGDSRRVTEQAVGAYRKAMTDFAGMRTVEIWYAHLEEEAVIQFAGNVTRANEVEMIADKAKTKDSLQALERLAIEVDGEYRLKSEPPLLVPLREIRDELPRGEIKKQVDSSFAAYGQTVHDECKVLLERFRPVDAAVKVVGVGSVGTHCAVMLLEGRDRKDPLFLQVKEATRSVLEEFLPASPYPNHGQRVVEGQRLMQSASDIFLGWDRGTEGRHYYWRQLRDWKGSFDVDSIKRGELLYLARLCGWTLGRAHARTGDPIAIAAYLGKSNTFDQAMTEFAERYADQNERDFEAFKDAIRRDHLEVAEE